jgi:type II secretory pathway pseudopilin PulG
VLVAMALLIVLAGVTMPATAASIDASRARDAAGFIAARFRFAKQQAVFRSASTGLVFDLVGNRWTFRVCADGNGNGLRRLDLGHSQDVCAEGPYDIETLFPGVSVGVDSTIRGPDGEPGSPDAVRFGRSDMASFSPTGGCTAGTLFLRSAKGVQYAVRVAGVTGRTRVLRYDPAARVWLEL